MTIIKLKGGLGNQMFQYAYGRSLELTGKKVIFDTSFYSGNKAEGDTPRSLGLDNFRLETESKFSNKKRPLLDLINKIAFRLKLRGNGYWQSYKYFNEKRETIIKDFALKVPLEQTHPELLNQITSSNSVSLAVRRTDYLLPVNLKSIGICSTNYYQKAIEFIESKVENPAFFVVCDDLSWVKDNISFKSYSVTYISELRKSDSITDYQELALMSKCKHNIIANSSFSWWPAWLNQNPDKIVIAPDIWFTDGSVKVDDIIPSSWIKLPRD